MRQPHAYVRGNVLTGWHVRTRQGDFVVLRRADFDETGPLAPYRHHATFEITGWDRDPPLRQSLVEIYESVYGQRIAAPLRTVVPWLVDRIQDAFRRGDLVLIPSDWHLSEMGSGGSPPRAHGEEPKEIPFAAPMPEPVPEKTWFRARLRDEDGIPMAGEDYVLVDTNGVRTEGKLDANGEVYIPPRLPSGTCTISFPKIHLNPRKRKK